MLARVLLSCVACVCTLLAGGSAAEEKAVQWCEVNRVIGQSAGYVKDICEFEIQGMPTADFLDKKAVKKISKRGGKAIGVIDKVCTTATVLYSASEIINEEYCPVEMEVFAYCYESNTGWGTTRNGVSVADLTFDGYGSPANPGWSKLLSLKSENLVMNKKEKVFIDRATPPPMANREELIMLSDGAQDGDAVISNIEVLLDSRGIDYADIYVGFLGPSDYQLVYPPTSPAVGYYVYSNSYSSLGNLNSRTACTFFTAGVSTIVPTAVLVFMGLAVATL
jgi:hypothetical protein